MSKLYLRDILKGSFTIRKELFKDFFSRHKNKFIGIAVLFFIEACFTLRFYMGEPEIPTGIVVIDVCNAVFRDVLLVSIVIFLRKHITWVRQTAQDYCPIVILSILWLGISMVIIHSLNLNFSAITLMSVLTGVINNVIFVVLAGYLYTKGNNILSKTIYFFSYLFTLLIFYSDTIYFFVTSTHIQKVLFDNLNNYSITGVLYTADKVVLFGILISFFFLMLLFRTPKRMHTFRKKNVSTLIIMICILANFVNFTTAYVYPKALMEDGFDEEAEIEKSRNLSRDLLTESVTINIVREFLRNDDRHVNASNHLYRVAFSEQETKLLNELKIDVTEKPVFVQKTFPYEKIIVIVAESFHRDYLHFYNSQIPIETTEFWDSLMAKYPHSDHYYPSNKPTNQGLNSIFLSQSIYSEDQSFENNVTLFKTLESKGYDTVFLEATSQYYNDEFRAYKKRFGMHTYKAKEDLERQGYVGSTGWGFHNDVMYDETIKILEQNRDNKIFIVTKTIDSHQPFPYCGLSEKDIPENINKQYKNVYLKGIYWENITLQKFFHDLEERNLMDDKTLIIVTSDHNPHPSQNDNYKRLGQGDLSLSLAPIPLIFISKNLQPFDNFNSAGFASQIDFAPTLLGILGIPSPPEFSGRNMLTIPEDRSYAIGCVGETIYYWSKNNHMKTDMYSGNNQNESEKALIHLVQDSYVKYFQGNSVNKF
ncbi:LTA synthase family protein [Pelosinus sp. sgz500959]|uniref:LTA synthase family protein n=1 Tax=Pelosinus sp. sgz500959 TaxID=3242472 RepID=UPI00366E261C